MNHRSVNPKLIDKIKSCFARRALYCWQDLNRKSFLTSIAAPTTEALLDIGMLLKNTLPETNELGNSRYRMHPEKAILCRDLNELIPALKQILQLDFEESSLDAMVHNWEFLYALHPHSSCSRTFCISNLLRQRSGKKRQCLYRVVSVQKHNGCFYLWNHHLV